MAAAAPPRGAAPRAAAVRVHVGPATTTTALLRAKVVALLLCTVVVGPRSAAPGPVSPTSDWPQQRPGQPGSMLAIAAAVIQVVTRVSSALPPWSWDTMQTYVHCANMSGPWAPWAAAQLAKASFVVLEKPHGVFSSPVNDSAETKIAAGCKQIKDAAEEAGKRTDCYMYTEVDWARTYYSLGHAVDADLEGLGMHYANGTAFTDTNTLTTPNHVPGPDGLSTFHYKFHAYDFRKPKMQQLWSQRITDAVATGYVDGSFIDGNRGGWGFHNTNACQGDAECIAALKAGLQAAHESVAKIVGPNKTLISNYPTPEALSVCNGGMCERCGHDANTVVQLQKTYFGVNGTKRCGLFGQPCELPAGSRIAGLLLNAQ
jgi:hypothetical protein